MRLPVRQQQRLQRVGDQLPGGLRIGTGASQRALRRLLEQLGEIDGRVQIPTQLLHFLVLAGQLSIRGGGRRRQVGRDEQPAGLRVHIADIHAALLAEQHFLALHKTL